MNIIVGCVVINDDKVLMVRESKGKGCGKWGFPVGHLENNETIFEGAIRETYEESGYNVKLTGILPITETFNEKGKYVLIKFMAEVISKDSKIADDVSDVMWMNVSDVLNLSTEEFRYCNSNKKVLKYVLDNEIYPLDLIRGNIFEN